MLMNDLILTEYVKHLSYLLFRYFFLLNICFEGESLTQESVRVLLEKEEKKRATLGHCRGRSDTKPYQS